MNITYTDHTTVTSAVPTSSGTTITSGASFVSTPTLTVSTSTLPAIDNIQSYAINTKSGTCLCEYYYEPIIIDINVYGHDKPKVVEVEFKYQGYTKKIKAICNNEDEFDLKKGVYIALSKLLYKNEYTTEGIEEMAHQLSLKKENEKKVDKAIKDYHKKLRAEEENKQKEKEEKAARKRRKEKNDARKRRRKEKASNYLKQLIKEAME